MRSLKVLLFLAAIALVAVEVHADPPNGWPQTVAVDITGGYAGPSIAHWVEAGDSTPSAAHYETGYLPDELIGYRLIPANDFGDFWTLEAWSNAAGGGMSRWQLSSDSPFGNVGEKFQGDGVTSSWSAPSQILNPGGGGGTSVPEPTGSAALCLGLITLVTRRRSSRPVRSSCVV